MPGKNKTENTIDLTKIEDGDKQEAKWLKLWPKLRVVRYDKRDALSQKSLDRYYTKGYKPIEHFIPDFPSDDISYEYITLTGGSNWKLIAMDRDKWFAMQQAKLNANEHKAKIILDDSDNFGTPLPDTVDES